MLKTYTFNRSHFVWMIFGILAVAVIAMPEVYAQEAAAEGGGSTEPVQEAKTLWDNIVTGGWAMYPLGLLSVGFITLTVYNGMQLTAKKFVPPELKASVLDKMADVRVRSAIEASADSSSYLGRMLATSLPNVDATDTEGLGKDKVDDAVADFTVRENPAFMSWIGYFSVIAQAAPMVGLLGTVSGMIKAFATLGMSGGSDPGEMASAIGEALMTTATGLVVALPCLFAFFFFKNKFNQLVADSHQTVDDAMALAMAAVHGDQQLAKVPEGIAEG
ncbi:MAG: MotA/TolQ/ExbB proton channel family protein [Verrucomicrobia bacterium]|nr:MotA/TolQ/ExbB proton channel family protein [Verrucomicrobiota bacterium]